MNHTYINAANDIGAVLVRDAIWTDETCGWLAPQVVSQQGRNLPAVAACPPDFRDGAGGVVFFLARLLQRSEQPLLRKVVVAATERLLLSLTQSSDTPLAQAMLVVAKTTKITLHESTLQNFFDQHGADRAPPSDDESLANLGLEIGKCHPSLSPLHVQISELSSRISDGQRYRPQDWSPIRIAAEAMDRWNVAAIEYPCFVDAVVADRFLSIGQLTGDPNWIRAAETFADHVIEMTVRHGQTWRGPIGFEYPPLGLAHGLAGIGYFLMRLSSVQ